MPPPSSPADPVLAIVEALPASSDGRAPNHGSEALRAARRLNLRTVLLTADRPAPYPADLADTRIHCDTSSVAAVSAALAPYRPFAVFSWVGPYVAVANQAARRLGLIPTVDPATLADKAAVRACLDRAGLAGPDWSVIDVTAPPPWPHPPYPLVVKPVDGFSSIDARLVTNDEELHALVARHRRRTSYGRGFAPSHRLLCEQWLRGPLISVEGAVSDGHLSVWGFSDRAMGPAPCFIETSVCFAADEPAPGLVPFTRKVIDALDYRTGAFHLELIATGDGPALVEINPRLVGAGIHQAIDLTTGASCAEAVLRAYLGEPAHLPQPRGAACLTHLVAPRSGTLLRIAGLRSAAALPGVHAVVRNARDGAPIDLTGSNADRLAYVLTTGADRAHCRQSATAALAELAPIIDDRR